MDSTIIPPFSERDLTAILHEWAAFVPVQTPADIYLAGSAALILCAGFRGSANEVAGRKAHDIDFYASEAAHELFRPNLGILGRQIGKFGSEDYYYPFDRDAGDIFLAPLVPQREKYFYTPASLNDSKTTGLAVHVLKEDVQLALKAGFVSHSINKLRAVIADPKVSPFMNVPLEENDLLKNVADINRLCKMLNVEGPDSLQQAWQRHDRATQTTIDRSMFIKQWKMVDVVRASGMNL